MGKLFGGRAWVAVGVAGLAIGALPATASAGTAQLTSSTDDRSDFTTDFLVYTAAPGEQNRLTVGVEGSDEFGNPAAFVVTDTAGVTPGRGCTRVGADPTRVRCPRIGDDLAGGNLRLGDGNDTATVNSGAAAFLEGGTGDDVLRGDPEEGTGFAGGSGRDVMVGGGSIDRFDEGSGPNGSDRMLGRGGQDFVDYSSRRGAVRADLDGRADDGQRGERDRVGADVENLLGGRGADRLTGSRSANELIGGPGRDVLRGGGGNDTLTGGTGADDIVAGRGRDNVEGGSGRDRIVTLDRLRDQVDCGGGGDRLRADRRDRRRGCERMTLR